MLKIKIGKKIISEKNKSYFIADIAANHDGSLQRAKKLIRLCAKAGADAAKFQHFKAETIVSDYGFKKIGKITHQKKWKKSVFQVYRDASIKNSWTKHLKKECKKNNIDFLTAPYDLDYVDSTDKFIPAFKIGSGDITWHEIIRKISKKRKPVILATGASSLSDVKIAVKEILKLNKNLVLMQCNTNYTASNQNYNYLNLNVLNQYKSIFKNKIILGLSDHTEGHNSVLGAIAIGAKVIEKHFTDNNNRIGPDHKFSMNPKTWRKMIIESRKLENSLGDGHKRIEHNEKQAVIVQRRAIRAKKFIKKGEKINKNKLEFLRPCPINALEPYKYKKILGKFAKKNIDKGDIINWKKIK